MEDFREAIRDVEPSALREIYVEVPKVTWGEVGGLEEVKDRLKESVEWPLSFPERFEHFGIEPSVKDCLKALLGEERLRVKAKRLWEIRARASS